jgi:Fe-S oxidoreductase
MSTVAFDAAEFFGGSQECERLQVAREEMTWHDRYATPDRPVDVLLNLSCGAQFTPHLMLEAVDVFEALGVSFAAVAGRQFCCGRVYHRIQSPDLGDRMAAAAITRMASYRPRVTVQWCASCRDHFHDVSLKQHKVDFLHTHYTHYLADLIEGLGDRVPWKQDVRARVMIHAHQGEHPERDKDLPSVLRIFSRLPGVEVVGDVRAPALGAPCGMITGTNNSRLATMIGSAQYAEVQADLQAQADALGADTLACLYHACSREWGKFASDRLPARHYISIVAEALGCAHPDRFQAYWRLGNAGRVVERARPIWESWGIHEAEARRLADKFFNPNYADAVPKCACDGTGLMCGSAISAVPTAPGLSEIPVITLARSNGDIVY